MLDLFGIKEDSEAVVGCGLGLTIETVDYKTILSKVSSFISLDISVNSTGWVKWHNGVLRYGVYGLEADSELERRQEFKKFLSFLFGNEHYELVFIEDTIGSCNYKVLKYLVQLNSIADDMVYDKLLDVGKVVREDNKVWKKNLSDLSGIVGGITKAKDKIRIVEDMNELGFRLPLLPDSKVIKGFVDMTEADSVKQDVYDALGMAIGIIYRDYFKKDKLKGRKLKTDIRKGYNIKQFNTLEEVQVKAKGVKSKKVVGVQELDYIDVKRDLVFNFKKAVEEFGDDKAYVITVSTSKLGLLALEKDLKLDKDICYLLVYRA